MIDLLGLFSIALVSFMTVVTATRLPSISKILYVALIVRIILLYIGESVKPALHKESLIYDNVKMATRRYK